MKKETALEAFLRQTKIDPNSYNQTEEYEKILEEEGKRQAMMRYMDQTKGAFSYRPISDKVDIPTKLTEEDINQSTETSEQMNNYDHSLEKDRWRKIGGLDCEGDRGVGNNSIEMEEI